MSMRYIVIPVPAWTDEKAAEDFRDEINQTFQPHYDARLLHSENGVIDTLQLDADYSKKVSLHESLGELSSDDFDRLISNG